MSGLSDEPVFEPIGYVVCQGDELIVVTEDGVSIRPVDGPIEEAQ